MLTYWPVVEGNVYTNDLEHLRGSSAVKAVRGLAKQFNDKKSHQYYDTLVPSSMLSLQIHKIVIMMLDVHRILQLAPELSEARDLKPENLYIPISQILARASKEGGPLVKGFRSNDTCARIDRRSRP